MAIFADVHDIAESLQIVAGELQEVNESLARMEVTFARIGEDIHRLAEAFNPTVVGIEIVPGIPPFPHKENAMSHKKSSGDKLSVELQKKSQLKQAMASPMAGDAGNFVLIDNEDNTCTVVGKDSAGNTVDISGVASISVQSDNPDVVTVDPPTGMTFVMHAVGPIGTADIQATANWNDGSVGPFSFTLPVETKAGGPTGIMIVPGTPVPRTP